MATISQIKGSSDANTIDIGGYTNNVVTKSFEIDIADAVANGLTSTDQISFAFFPEGTILLGVDAEITEALVLGATNSIKIGTTSGEPVEFVNAQTDTAVGRFSAYASGATSTTLYTTDTTFYCEVTGAGVTSGKIKVTATVIAPGGELPGIAKSKVYTNA